MFKKAALASMALAALFLSTASVAFAGTGGYGPTTKPWLQTDTMKIGVVGKPYRNIFMIKNPRKEGEPRERIRARIKNLPAGLELRECVQTDVIRPERRFERFRCVIAGTPEQEFHGYLKVRIDDGNNPTIDIDEQLWLDINSSAVN